MLQSLHIVINMSPTGEGAVSLSPEKVHAKRDCGGLRGGWAAGVGPGPGATLGTQSLSSGLASQTLVSGHDWQPLYPPLVC